MADALEGPWHEHARTPVVAGDARLSRRAGRVLVGQERIVCFAQAGISEFGTDVRAVEITRLSRGSYPQQSPSTVPDKAVYLIYEQDQNHGAP